jgi:uncharacterized membrane protein YjgN (DUF898 family)
MENKQVNSNFDGGLLGLIGVSLLGFIITLFTLGICLPWAVCIKEDWITKHTVIEGRRLMFNGTAMGLFGTWIKILLLTIITIGIYSFWANIALKKWVVKHTCFAN